MQETVDWLNASHARFVRHVRQLSDADLDVPRRANWGELKPTRSVVSTILQHDTTRGRDQPHPKLLAEDDRWRWG
jgi:hypothetical protein